MFNHILVAVDGSEYSRLVIPTAIEVARKFKSQVFVLHVSEHNRGRGAAYGVETAADATRLVVEAVREFTEAGLVAAGEVHDVGAGHVAKNIVETADAQRAELIVMGSRGLSDVQGLLLGSVTHKVMQLAQTAVLVAKGPLPVKVEEPELETVPGIKTFATV